MVTLEDLDQEKGYIKEYILLIDYEDVDRIDGVDHWVIWKMGSMLLIMMLEVSTHSHLPQNAWRTRVNLSIFFVR